MRIAVVHSYYSAEQPSGENVVVDDQVAALRRAGHDVLLLRQETDELVRHPAYAIRAAWTTVSGWGRSGAQELVPFDPDIVHVHNTFPNWGTRWLGQWRARSVVTLHNYRSVCAAGTLFRDGDVCQECLKHPVIPAVQHKCYRGSAVASLPVAIAASPRGPLRKLAERAARTIVLNGHAEQVLRPLLGRTVDIIPNFVANQDASCVSSTAVDGWMYIGRLVAEKGILQLIEEWPAEERLTIVGAGPLEPAVQELVTVMDSVRFAGKLAREDLLPMLKRARGLVVPSLWSEGIPTVVLEALAAGVPLVLSERIAAAVDLARYGAARTYDPLAGPAGLATVLADVQSAEGAMRAAARRTFVEQYSEAIWLERINRVYEQVRRDAAL